MAASPRPAPPPRPRRRRRARRDGGGAHLLFIGCQTMNLLFMGEATTARTGAAEAFSATREAQADFMREAIAKG